MKTTSTRHLREVSRLHYSVAKAWLRFLDAPAHSGRDGRPMRPADLRRLIRQCNAFTGSIDRVQLAAARALECMERGV